MRCIVSLTVLAVFLVAAFLVAPALLVGDGLATVSDNAPLAHAFATELTVFWNARTSHLTPGLMELVDLWRRWHALKVVISVLFTATTIGLASALCRQLRAPGAARGRRWSGGLAVVAATMLLLGGFVAIAANIQATAAPLSALLPLLPSDPPPGDLRRAMTEIRDGLVNADSAFADRPALGMMIDSQRVYLTSLAITATVMAVACAAGVGLAVRGRSRSVAIVLAAVTAGAVAAAVAAWTSVTDPVGSLLNVFSFG